MTMRQTLRKTNDWAKLDAQLIELWADFTITCTMIGDKLGVTKNAVIGRAHRLDLPKRPTGFPWNNPGWVPPRKPKHPVAAAKAPPEASLPHPAPEPPRKPKPPPPPAPPQPKPTPRPPVEHLIEAPIEMRLPVKVGELTLVDLGPHHCKWPMNSPERGGLYLFCGEARFDGSPYCERHLRLSNSGAAAKRIPTPAWFPKPVEVR